MIHLEQRSYTSGTFFRPKPVIVERPESNLLIIATPWGNVDSGQKVAATMVEQFELLSKDDMTTPYESIPTISAAANRLRVGALTANNYLFRTENGKTWKAAVELAAIHYDKGVLSWVQVGSPHLILLEKGVLHPLAYEADWAHQSGNEGPLFTQALGIENMVPLKSGSLRARPESQLLMVSRGTLPRRIFGLPVFDMEKVVQTMTNDNSVTPFWLGLTQFAQDSAA